MQPHAVATSELDKINKKEKSHHTHKTPPTTNSRWHHADARVHYTVLTQHPEPATHTTTTDGTHQPVRHTQKGIMPQTPNNAPTYNQHSFSYTWTLLRMSQSTVSTLRPAD